MEQPVTTTPDNRLHTPVCDLLGIDVPILQAGMGMGARAALVAAVSGAGGLGVIGGAPLPPTVLRAEIREVRDRTDRPFGVDLLFPPQLTMDDNPAVAAVRDAVEAMSADQRAALPELATLVTPGHVASQVEVCLEEGVPVLVSGLGSPGPWLHDLHAAGATVLSIAGSVRHARRHAEEGVDGIIASGADGGGHVGAVGSLSLWRSCVDAVDIPVIAGGGIADGRTLAAALVLGCQGAWIGTRFLATIEADCHVAAKEAIVAAGTDDTTVSRAISGKPMRVLRNGYVDSWRGREHEIAPFPLQALATDGRGAWAASRGDLVDGVLPAGSAVGIVDSVESAADVVRAIVAGAAQALAPWFETHSSNLVI